jgi:hypothetical protein
MYRMGHCEEVLRRDFLGKWATVVRKTTFVSAFSGRSLSQVIHSELLNAQAVNGSVGAYFSAVSGRWLGSLGAYIYPVVQVGIL